MGLAVIFYEKFLEHDDFPIVVAEVKNIKKWEGNFSEY